MAMDIIKNVILDLWDTTPTDQRPVVLESWLMDNSHDFEVSPIEGDTYFGINFDAKVKYVRSSFDDLTKYTFEFDFYNDKDKLKLEGIVKDYSYE